MKGMFLILCLLTATVEGGFDGDYKVAGYDIYFFNTGSFLDGDNTKEINANSIDISVSSENAYTATFSDSMLHRSILNMFTGEPEVRCINSYSSGIYASTESGSGTVTPAPNLVLKVFPAAEDIEIPLYFTADTNIAVMIERAREDEENAVESGLGLSLLIRKGSGMDESSMSGTYLRASMGNGVYGEGRNDRLTLVRSIVEFDGSGNYTENGLVWMADRTTSEETITNGVDHVVDSICTLSVTEMPFPDSGTYSVAANGTVVTHGFLGTVTNQLSPDGKVAASIHVINGTSTESYLNVAVKLPENMLTNAVDAVYFITQLSEKYEGVEANGIFSNSVEALRAWFYLESDGSFSARGDFWGIDNVMDNFWGNINPPGVPTNLVSGNVFSSEATKNIQFATGTYSIETNGVVTLSFDTDDGDDDDDWQWQLSADGEFLVFGDAWRDGESGGDLIAERQMGIGIRRDPPPPIPSPVVFNNDMAMTSTGLVMTATMPTNHPVEGISTDNLAEGRWSSAGIYSTETGTVDIHDPGATNAAVRFYSTTFTPW